MSKRSLARNGVLLVGGVVTGASAFAVDPVSAQAALTELSTGATGFGPVMFGMAVVATGILIGVKWIKRGRGAA